VRKGDREDPLNNPPVDNGLSGKQIQPAKHHSDILLREAGWGNIARGKGTVTLESERQGAHKSSVINDQLLPDCARERKRSKLDSIEKIRQETKATYWTGIQGTSALTREALNAAGGKAKGKGKTQITGVTCPC